MTKTLNRSGPIVEMSLNSILHMLRNYIWTHQIEGILRGAQWFKSLEPWDFGTLRLREPGIVGPQDCGTLGFIHLWVILKVILMVGWLVGCWLGDSTTSHLVLFISIDVEKVVGGCFWISASALVLFWPWILNLTMTMGHDQDPSLTKSIFQDSKYQDTNVGYFWLKSCPKKIVCEGLLTKGNFPFFFLEWELP